METALGLGIEILLRVPKISFVLQGEDTVNFKELKAVWRRKKHEKFLELNIDRRVKSVGYTSLDFEHMMDCFEPAFEVGHTREKSLGLEQQRAHSFHQKTACGKTAAPPSTWQPRGR
eukprot:scaffold294719_cov19-Prasinocladus_malaysianus.AAC.1